MSRVDTSKELAYVGESSRIGHRPASSKGWPVKTLCGLTATGLSSFPDLDYVQPTCQTCYAIESPTVPEESPTKDRRLRRSI